MMHFYRYFGKTNHNNFYFYFILHNWRKMTIFAKKMKETMQKSSFCDENGRFHTLTRSYILFYS